MTEPAGSPPAAAFQAHAGSYEADLARGLAVSGEGREYFAHGRIAWLARCLALSGDRPARVLDFGCGDGASAALLGEILGAREVLGIDPVPALIEVARRTSAGPRATFTSTADHRPDARIDVGYCNGVFHHIPPAERAASVDLVARSLRPGGWFALWENNPWNPGTRFVMSRIPFDRDAILVWPWQARALVRAAGLEVVRTDFLFVFPHRLRFLRGFEPSLSRLPLGAQYQVLCRKPFHA